MRKILLIIAATIVVVLLVATIGLYWYFSGDGIRRALEQQATSWLGQPVRIESAAAQIFPRFGLGLSGIEVGEPVQLTLASVDLSTDLRALLARRIEDASVVISDSRIQLPLPFDIPEGDTSTPADSTPQDGGVEVVSIRQISLRNIRILSRGREIAVSADSSLSGDRLTIDSFTAESDSTSLQVEGEAVLEPTVDARVKVTAARVDLDELLALVEAFSPEPRAGSARGASQPQQLMKVSAEIGADHATVAGVQMQAFNARMALDGERLALSPLTFALFGGTYDGSLNARLGDRMSLTLRSHVKRLDVAQIAAFGGSPDTITGALDGDATFSAQGVDMAAALASANGKGTVSIVDGTIKRLDLVRTVVLFFGRPAPDTAAASDQFERIDATFSLAKQVFRADMFSMQSRDADITGTATLALETGALDGTVDLKLSEELSAQAGRDLVRFTRDQDRVVLPARLGGTLQQPRITINAVAALRRGIQNELGERLKGLFGK